MQVTKGKFQVEKVGTRYLEGSFEGKYRARVERLGEAKGWQVGELHEAHFVVGRKAGRFTLRLASPEEVEASREAKRQAKLEKLLRNIQRYAHQGYWPEELVAQSQALGASPEVLSSLKAECEAVAQRNRVAKLKATAQEWLQYISQHLRKGRWYGKGEAVVKEKAEALRKEGALEEAEELLADLEALRSRYQEALEPLLGKEGSGEAEPRFSLPGVYLVPADSWQYRTAGWFRLSGRVPSEVWRVIGRFFSHATYHTEDTWAEMLADSLGPGWYVARNQAPKVEEILGTAPELRIAAKAAQEEAALAAKRKEEERQREEERAKLEAYEAERARLTQGVSPRELPHGTPFFHLIQERAPVLEVYLGGAFPKKFSLYALDDGGFLELEEVGYADGWGVAAIRHYPAK